MQMQPKLCYLWLFYLFSYIVKYEAIFLLSDKFFYINNDIRGKKERENMKDKEQEKENRIELKIGER